MLYVTIYEESLSVRHLLSHLVITGAPAHTCHLLLKKDQTPIIL